MIRLLQIVVFSCVATFLVGCEAPEEDRPIWEQVKIGDLAPIHSGKRPSQQLLKTINFDFYIFEMPAENINVLDDIWQMLQSIHFARSRKMGALYTRPVKFNDYDAFGANSFSVGLGQIQMWNEIGGLLDAGGAKRMPTLSLLLADGQSSDLTITNLYREQPVFYISPGGSMEGVTIGPGKLVLRIKAEKIPGLRGICNVSVHPVFSPPIRSSILPLAARAKAGELAFISAGFGLKMSPGDFFLLGPEKYISDQISLGSLFFSKPEGSLFFSKSEAGPFGKPERKPAIRIFLLVCTSMNV